MGEKFLYFINLCRKALLGFIISDSHRQGIYEIKFERIRFPAGMYFVELKSDNSSDTKKILTP